MTLHVWYMVAVFRWNESISISTQWCNHCLVPMRHRSSPTAALSIMSHGSRSTTQRSHNNHGILFVALGFLLMANVSCFVLFLVLFEPEETSTMMRGLNVTTTTIPSQRIPKILIFTHSINLLTAELSPSDESSSDSHYDELVALQQNVQNIMALHPDCSVRFLTDDDCKDSIRATHTPEIGSELVSYFEHETTGMFKADLCRGVALLESGGLYFDVDLGVRMNIHDVLHETTEFATIRVHPQSQYPGNFFQAFMAATPNHTVIRTYVDLFLSHYRKTQSWIHGGPIGVQLLKQAFDQTETVQRTHLTDVTTTTHLNQTTEIWQEFLYNWDYEHSLLSHVPPPTWGTRRACKFIVVSAPKIPLTVPFYSRIANSRMCPMPKTNATITATNETSVVETTN